MALLIFKDQEPSPKRWPGEVDEAFPEIFNTIPTQPSQTKPGQLTQEQLKKFFENGFVVIENYFSKELLDACREDIAVLVDNLAQDLYKAGKISNLYENYGFFQRLIKLNEDFPGAIIILAKRGDMPKAVRDLWSCDQLVNIMEQLLGTSDIVGHPVWNLRMKVPQNSETTVPWHQDAGYCDNDSYRVLQPTAWIPLLDADTNNGCLQMVRGGHKSGRVAKHKCCHADTWYVWLEEEEIEQKLDVDMSQDVVTCPVPYGGMVLFNNLVPHHRNGPGHICVHGIGGRSYGLSHPTSAFEAGWGRSMNNHSDVIRWSLDLRWQRADQPIGFYGIKDGVRMRSSTDPEYQIDWDPFIGVNRMDEEKKNMKTKEKDEDWDTTIQGPWMLKWEMANTNRHTSKMTTPSA